MKGLITKPQFDTNIFSIGKAVLLIRNSSAWNMDCLILESSPMELKLLFINSQNEDETITIYVEDIVKKTYIIEFLCIEREKE